ncbi:MAG: Dps family protein [Candidatus Kryptoniota bacterium]
MKGNKDMTPDIGINDKNRKEVVKILNTLLSDEYLLYTQTRKYHWNVFGPHFNDLHKFFQEQYEELDDIVDDVAERARALGGIASGTMTEFLKDSRLKEEPGINPESSKMVENLLKQHESIIKNLRTDIETCATKYLDAGTSDFLTQLLEKHEKMGWMLRAAISDKP